MRLRTKIAAALLGDRGPSRPRSTPQRSTTPGTRCSTTTASSSPPQISKNFQVILAGNPVSRRRPDNSCTRSFADDAGRKAEACASPSPTTSRQSRPGPITGFIWSRTRRTISAATACCRGTTRFKPAQTGIFSVFAVYCRNDMTMSQASVRTPATGPTDPRIAEAFRELFMVVFSDSPALRPYGGTDRR